MHFRFANSSSIQILGYYIALKHIVKPPICFVITEKAVQFVMFPFRHSTQSTSLVNAIMLNQSDLMTRTDNRLRVNQHLLVLVAILTCPHNDLQMDMITLDDDIAVKKVTIEHAIEDTSREVFSTTFLWCLFSLFKYFCLLHTLDAESQNKTSKPDSGQVLLANTVQGHGRLLSEL